MRKFRLGRLGRFVFILFLLFLLAGCKPKDYTRKRVTADGSSTVFPITEAVAEEFQKANPNIRVTIGLSGTGGGFKRFLRGETDISNASRPIKEEEKKEAAKGLDFGELQVAYDGLSVMVNPGNKFVESLTVAELKKIWEPGSKVNKWNQVRPNWPNREIHLYGPGTDSGTFDFFTEKINGKEGASRADYTASEDDNVLVQGISGDEDALGYFGYAYYRENKDKLKLVAIDAGEGAVLPSKTTVLNGSYKPLSRPLYIYVNKKSLKRPEVKDFVLFYLREAPRLAEEVGYIKLPTSKYNREIKEIEKF